MHITMREGDEIVCTVCHRRWSLDETAPDGCEKYESNIIIEPKKVTPLIKTPDKVHVKHISMIGFLAAKLACYEPDCDEVTKALEYLKCHSK
jgi:hypothetical protein